MNTIKVGVIGVGIMGKNHIRVYSSLPNVDIVAISDVNEDILKIVGKEYKINYYSDYSKMLKKEDLDAVSITVPTSLHKEVSICAIQHEIAVLLEKPIASNMKDAVAILNEIEKHNAIFMVGHIERFNPSVTKLKELIEKGSLGEIIAMSAKRVGPFSPRTEIISVIIDLGIHDIDVMRYISQKDVLSVYARAGSKKFMFEDYASILLEFDEDIVGNIEVNTLTPTKIRNLTVTCSNGFSTIDYVNQEILLYGKILDIDYKDYEELIMKFGKPEIGRPKIKKEEPLKIEIEHFLDCVKFDKKPSTDAYESIKNLEIALKALDSAQKNKRIQLK